MNRKLGAMGWVYLILATVGLIGSFFLTVLYPAGGVFHAHTGYRC